MDVRTWGVEQADYVLRHAVLAARFHGVEEALDAPAGNERWRLAAALEALDVVGAGGETFLDGEVEDEKGGCGEENGGIGEECHFVKSMAESSFSPQSCQ